MLSLSLLKKGKKGLYQRAMQIIRPVECIQEKWLSSVSKKDGGLLHGVGLRLDYYEGRTTEEGE